LNYNFLIYYYYYIYEYIYIYYFFLQREPPFVTVNLGIALAPKLHDDITSSPFCPPQPPPADLDSAFLDIDDVIDVSSRLLGLLDRQPLRPGDPLFLEVLCESLRFLTTGSGDGRSSHVCRRAVVTVV